MSQFFNDSIFWIEVEKIKPNPFQPRREFDEMALRSLADSIRQYGVLQALVVTRKEITKEDGGLATEYELIAGERRLRASKLAGLTQVPCLIKTGDEDNLLKLELAMIENLQREDLNPIDRAKSFSQLADQFKLKHIEIAKKIGKSREYVTNTIRLLTLPQYIQDALAERKITEGHTRPLLMVGDRPAEQETLFKEIVYKKLNVREAEAISRKIAFDRVRRKSYIQNPDIADMEAKLSESFGTRVSIETSEKGGQIKIDFFSQDDLKVILEAVAKAEKRTPTYLMDKHIEKVMQPATREPEKDVSGAVVAPIVQPTPEEIGVIAKEDEKQNTEMALKEAKEEEVYSLDQFSI